MSEERLSRWRARAVFGAVVSSVRAWLRAAVHNCIVHPLMMFLPADIATRMHDRNADWAFPSGRYDELALEDRAVRRFAEEWRRTYSKEADDE